MGDIATLTEWATSDRRSRIGAVAALPPTMAFDWLRNSLEENERYVDAT